MANQNAHTLLTVAEDASRRHAFGVAVALSILSAEEAAKSLGLATRALSHQPD
ncbi:AbiV family abortive infection protein [Solemya pervernicosa gill symbiont]|uniref:AbiV family abortive infection protein n=1 Tax=Solemya pervernicosa gill symbiont TaxID=642797 RepID=UPI0038B64BD4